MRAKPKEMMQNQRTIAQQALTLTVPLNYVHVATRPERYK